MWHEVILAFGCQIKSQAFTASDQLRSVVDIEFVPRGQVEL